MLAKCFALFIILVGYVSSKAFVKFGHFIPKLEPGAADERGQIMKISILYQNGTLNRTEYLFYLNTTKYIQTPDLPIKVNVLMSHANQTFEIEAVETNRTSVIFYWDSGIKKRQLEDVADPRKVFDKLTKNTSIEYPFENNTLWRLIFINPSDQVLELDVMQVVPDTRPGDFRKMKVFKADNKEYTYFIDTSYSSKILRLKRMDGTIENEHPLHHFGSQGIYTLYYIREGANGYIKVMEDFTPESRIVPIVFFFMYIALCVVIRQIWKQLRSTARKKFIETKKIRVETQASVQARATEDDIPYLDTFRGLAIICFIFVRAGGGNYAFLTESLWNGYTLGDLPKYAIGWIMGMCIPIAINRNEYRSRWLLCRDVAIKSVLMILMGSI